MNNEYSRGITLVSPGLPEQDDAVQRSCQAVRTSRRFWHPSQHGSEHKFDCKVMARICSFG